MKYKNIFEFLEVALVDSPNPSKEDIAKVKDEYYKAWHRHYNRQRRKVRKEFTLGFTPKVLKQINTKKGKMTISKYLYTTVYDSLVDENSTIVDQELFSNIHQKLLQVLTILEELLDSGQSSQIEQLLERMEQLEFQFSTL